MLRVHQGKGGWLVAPADGAAPPMPSVPLDDDRAAAPRRGRAPPRPSRSDASGSGRAASRRAAVIGIAADGVREFRRVLLSGQVRRWPMYLRNVKQIIRQAIRRSTSAPTASPTSWICCARRTRKDSSASIAIGRASSACSRAACGAGAGADVGGAAARRGAAERRRRRRSSKSRCRRGRRRSRRQARAGRDDEAEAIDVEIDGNVVANGTSAGARPAGGARAATARVAACRAAHERREAGARAARGRRSSSAAARPEAGEPEQARDSPRIRPRPGDKGAGFRVSFNRVHGALDTSRRALSEVVALADHRRRAQRAMRAIGARGADRRRRRALRRCLARAWRASRPRCRWRSSRGAVVILGHLTWVRSRRRQTTDAIAAAVDRDAALRGELRSAHWFESQRRRRRLDAFHVDRAADRAAGVDWTGLYPPVRAGRSWAVTAVLAAAAVVLQRWLARPLSRARGRRRRAAHQGRRSDGSRARTETDGAPGDVGAGRSTPRPRAPRSKS